MRLSHSRAQRYGSNANILGRAHVSRLKADLLEAIAFCKVDLLVLMEGLVLEI